MKTRFLLTFFISSGLNIFCTNAQIRNKNLDIFQPYFHQTQRYRDTRSIHSPTLEVLMHVPPQFENVNQFSRFLGLMPEKLRVRREEEVDNIEEGTRQLKNVRSYEVYQLHPRSKREVKEPDSTLVESVALNVRDLPEGVSGKYIRNVEEQPLLAEKSIGSESVVEMPESIRGPMYLTEAESLQEDENSESKQKNRRNTSGNEHEDQKPFWVRKNSKNPNFVTREGRVEKGDTYPPAQHRSETSRESHSMKDLDKSVSSNEIQRNSQDNYFASSNRRVYNSRQAENTPTPRSVYDLYDYTSPRRNQEGRNSFARNSDARDNRQVYNPNPDYMVNGYPRQYYQQRAYYDRNYPYYQPYPGEVVGRGVEYYHRSIDPSSGRIIYYANMPDSVRPHDGYQGRTFYNNGRTYMYDAYGRIVPVPPVPAPVDTYGRAYDYRYGRSLGVEPYPAGSDKYARGARYDSKPNLYRDESRNKTYVIFDADEKRTSYPRAHYSPYDYNRYLYPTGAPVVPPVQPPIVPAGPYQPPLPVVPGAPNSMYRGGYYNQPTWQGYTGPLAPYSPQPYTSSLIRTTPTSSYDKIKKM